MSETAANNPTAPSSVHGSSALTPNSALLRVLVQTDAALAPTLPPALMRTARPLASKTQIAKRTQALALADRLNGPEEEYGSGADAEEAALRSALENYRRPPTEVDAAT